MKSRLPNLLWISGILLVIAALAYASISGAGIPYQDPTPQQRARELWQHRVIDSLTIAGLLLIAAGVIAIVGRKLRKNPHEKKA